MLADLILHVVDASAPEERRLADMQAVDEVLEEIGAGEKPRLLVLNKADLLDEEERREVAAAPSRRGAGLGARRARGWSELRERIEAAFEETLAEVELLIPYSRGRRACTSCTRSPGTSSGPSARTAFSSAPGCPVAELHRFDDLADRSATGSLHARVAAVELPRRQAEEDERGAADAGPRGRCRARPLRLRGGPHRAGGAVERRHRGRGRDPRGPCRAGAAALGAGARARDRAGQQPRA